MGKTSRKKFGSERVSYLKVGAVLILTVWLMNFTIRVLQNHNPYIASWAGLGIVLLGMIYLYYIIFYAMAEYVYKIIYSDLIVERVISKTNHTTYSIDFKSIKRFVPYKQRDEKIKIKRRNYYVKSRDRDKWFLLEFIHDGELIRLVIQPGNGMAKSIAQRVSDHAD
ncbi:MAG: hypothetical protein AVO33_04980 [delta proteobacterium ML8_F1]|nr:MAG: hypothetical protein AVO33_04980 [delta proteobacterium ML8_F1]